MYKIIVFVFLFFRTVDSMAQDMTNSDEIEKKSSELYLNGNWSELIEYGNKALSKGYDYFYLRMRIGIAYYVQKKYMNAVKHFERGVNFNSSDNTALEYLYYSYLFSGRSNEARALTTRFPSGLKENIKPPKNKIIESVYTEGGIAWSSLNINFKNIDIAWPAENYGESNITQNMQYWHVGLNHQIGSKWSVYQGYSNIGIDYIRHIKTRDPHLHVIDTLDNYTLSQHDYYISINRQFKYFSLSPAFHLINVGFGKMNAKYDLTNSKYFFNKKDTTFLNYATSLSLIKNIGIYTCNLSAGFSQLNGLTQLQAGFSLTYFPLANTNFYGSSSVFYLNENSDNRLIETQKVGLKLVSKLWAEAGITYGNLQDYCENNAFVVFNTSDKILYKCDFSITAPLFKHFEFSLRYDYFNKENTYYRTDNVNKIESVTVNYQTQAILGGIKWKI